jgi:hypothetical protein
MNMNMKRALLLTLLVFLLSGVSVAQKIDVPCPTQLRDINDCPDTGCGSLDPFLNRQKNTKTGDPNRAEDIDYADLAAMPNRVPRYRGIGKNREPVRDAGEGKMVRMVAWALESRPQNTRSRNKRGESCNCGFTGVDDPENTDVHIVLVDDAILRLRARAGNGKTAAQNTLTRREKLSQTAEYTPRVRVARGEEFDGSKLKDLIGENGGALKVRVTGLQFYDSEHALGPFKLKRKTDWEIHPVFRLEYCPRQATCTKTGTANWVDINH